MWKRFETHLDENMAMRQMYVSTRTCQANSVRVPLVRHPCYVLSAQAGSHGSVILICIREVDVFKLRRKVICRNFPQSLQAIIRVVL